MAGDWIKIEHALPNKPEVMAIADALNISEMEVVGHLVCFWTWVDQNLSEECPAVSGTIRGLDRVSGRTGFAQAMIDVGWLRLENGSVEIPNYDDHLSQSAKSRAVEAKRKRKNRAKTSGTFRDISGTEHGTREEKRREDNNTPLIPHGGSGESVGPKKRNRKPVRSCQPDDAWLHVRRVLESWDKYERGPFNLARDALPEDVRKVAEGLFGWDALCNGSSNVDVLRGQFLKVW